MDVRFRPLSGAWPQKETPALARRSRHAFRASWQSTLTLLDFELGKLSARDVVIEVALEDRHIRLDGWPRGDAPEPTFPGVIVSFESKHGPLKYLTDAYDGYRSNLRAIALGLESLRAVDRYGITRRGEQYTGWRALPPAIPMDSGDPTWTVEEAAAFIAEQIDEPTTAEDVLADPKGAYRAAAKRLHPDTGGDPKLFRRARVRPAPDRGRVMAVKWARARSALAMSAKVERDLSSSAPTVLASIDQLRAAIRDDLDEVGLSLTDEPIAFSALYFSALTKTVAAAADKLGLLADSDTFEDRLDRVAGLAVYLFAPYAPTEARS